MRMEKEMAGKAHIMCIPFPAQGHINPMVQFAKRIASKGNIRVTLVVTTAISKHIEAKTSSINIEYISYEPNRKIDTIDAYMANIKHKVSDCLSELSEKYKSYGFPIDFIVFDSILPWTIDIGHQLGLKGAPLFTQACGVCAIYYHFYQGILKMPLEGPLVSMPSMPLLSMEVNDLPSSFYDGVYPGAVNLMANQFSHLHKADWIFFNTYDKLENEVVKWMASQWKIKTIGPTIPSMFLDKRLTDDKDYGISLFKPDAEGCIKWLEGKEPASVTYVSFGSLANVGEEQMEEVAWGLMTSNSYFLWVVRDSEQSKVPTNFLAEVGEKGLIVGWCPQLEVLAHKAVGSFMTHCGWNSTLEALSLGVPMLVMPQWTDQTTNAKFIVDVWRTGVRVKVHDKEIVTREEIAECIKNVMEGEKGDELRANARRWKELSKEAMDEGGSSDKNIEEFISELLCT